MMQFHIRASGAVFVWKDRSGGVCTDAGLKGRSDGWGGRIAFTVLSGYRLYLTDFL